ncbi:hypothetical protein HY797_04300 [Candidatus Falkowbacteria bacterium]|nr:hypothetical protein [Candidatus Falkowbacteria bacterium]
MDKLIILSKIAHKKEVKKNNNFSRLAKYPITYNYNYYRRDLRMTVLVDADLTGCKVAFLVPAVHKQIDGSAINAIEELFNRGIKHVRTVSIEEASNILAKTQQRHKGIPESQKFLKITSKGNITQLFC